MQVTLKELPEDLQEEALSETKRQGGRWVKSTLETELVNAFSWAASIKGDKYWREIHLNGIPDDQIIK